MTKNANEIYHYIQGLNFATDETKQRCITSAIITYGKEHAEEVAKSYLVSDVAGVIKIELVRVNNLHRQHCYDTGKVIDSLQLAITTIDELRRSQVKDLQSDNDKMVRFLTDNGLFTEFCNPKKVKAKTKGLGSEHDEAYTAMMEDVLRKSS